MDGQGVVIVLFLSFLILFTFAVWLFISMKDNDITRWGAVLIVSVSFGVLSGVIEYTFFPLLREFKMGPHVLLLFEIFGNLMSFLSQITFPYFLIMFSLYYCEAVNQKVKSILTYLLLMPIFFTFIQFPSFLFQKLETERVFFLPWVTTYVAVACIIFIYSYFIERNVSKKKSRFETMMILVPTIVGVILLYLFTKIQYPQISYYRFLVPFLSFTFLLFIVCSINNGLFGIKLHIERSMFNNTMRVVTSGAAMMNHSIKNRVINIHMLAEQMKSFSMQHRFKQFDEDIELVISETNQMMEIIKRVQKKTTDIVITETPNNLSDLIKDTLFKNKHYLESKKVSIMTEIDFDIYMLCDQIHVQEALANILHNAVDAVPLQDGQIEVMLHLTNKYVQVHVKDNGCGIDTKDMKTLFDPFYSTKRREDNFGLGLSYCYMVMSKHQGKITLQSEVSQGSIFTLHFPVSKVVKPDYFLKMSLINH